MIKLWIKWKINTLIYWIISLKGNNWREFEKEENFGRRKGNAGELKGGDWWKYNTNFYMLNKDIKKSWQRWNCVLSDQLGQEREF